MLDLHCRGDVMITWETLFSILILLQFICSGLCFYQHVKLGNICDTQAYKQAVQRGTVFRVIWLINVAALAVVVFLL